MKQLRGKNIYSLLVLLCFQLSYAQLSRTHYIPPISAADNSNATPQNQYLHISTPSVTPVSVTLTEIGGTVSVLSASNANPIEILIGSGSNTSFIADVSTTGAKHSNKGYSIQADKPVYVSVRLIAGAGQAQAGSLVSKGLSGLGTIFRIGTFTNQKTFTSATTDYLNFVSVMATENNTQVDFSDLAPGTIVENSTPLSVVLDYGETYVIALDPAVVSANRDGLVGALVSASKPIVVNCGSSNGSNSTGNGRDFGIDQIAPFETILIDGQTYSEYIFVRANGYDDIERPLIVAHLDNTAVYVNGDDTTGTLVATLSAGEYISIAGSYFSTQSSSSSNPGGNMYVWTSKTAFAYQGIGGSSSEANQELFFVPPLNCKTPKTINNIPLIQNTGSGSAVFSGGITIVTEVGASVLVNGAAITVSPQQVKNSTFETYLISGLTGNVSVSSDKQIYVSYYGANGAAALGGFYSGFIFKPEITPKALTTVVSELCIPNIELNISSLETFDSYQWFYNGVAIPGANAETWTPNSPGFYQLEGIITNCDTVLSDNIPVSSCPGDVDNDGVNDNIDSDNDNDGTLNRQESHCDLAFDLSNNSGPFFTANSVASTANNLPTTFTGYTDQSMVFQAAPITSASLSSSTYELTFNVATSFIIQQSNSASSPGTIEFDDEEVFIFSVAYDETLTVVDPDNQLLIDTNYDGIYDNNVEEFTAFEIRFKLNSAMLSSNDVSFSFHSNQASGFSIKYINKSETQINSAAFQLIQTCRPIDSDGDLVYDALDLDSDNDGIFDVIENGNTSLDQNQNGQIEEVELNDLNSDGRHDAALDPGDFDGDSVLNFLDLDSDNDGLYDLFESGIVINTLDLDNDGQIDLGFLDSNMNGASDVTEAQSPIDSDANMVPDFIQLDSDLDGCFDADEAGFTANLGILDGTAVDNNGLVTGGDGYNFALDSNSDGLFDYQEYVSIIPVEITSPVVVCEFENTTIFVSLETTSSSFDSIQWERSLDGGSSWTDVIAVSNSFEGQDTNSLKILNTKLPTSGTKFRARMERLDYVCGPIYTNEVELIVNPLPVVQSTVQLFQCDQDVDGITFFNLNEANQLLSSNYKNEQFSFYFSQADAELGTVSTAISNSISYENTTTDPLINPNKLYVRVETGFGCASVAELNLLVSTTQIPNTFSMPSYKECFDSSDGLTTFDFSDSEALILNLFPPTQSLTVTYYETESEALSETNKIFDISKYDNSTGQDQLIWVRVDSDADNSCVGVGSYIKLIVNPLPLIVVPTNNPYYCVGSTNSLTIDLPLEFDDLLLGPQSTANYSVSYYASSSDALSTTGSITTLSNSASSQQVFCRIDNLNTPCFDIEPFTIDFITNPQASSAGPYVVCDTDNDGVFIFNTTDLEATVLAGQTTMSIAYFDALGTPLTDSNGLLVSSPFPSTFSTTTSTIRAVVSNAFCADAFVDISFMVNNNTDFFVEDLVICDGSIEYLELDLEYPSNTYNYSWLLPNLDTYFSVLPEISIDQTGLYSVTVTNLDGSCSNTQSFEVFASEGPTLSLEDITVVEATSNNSISILESNLGSSNYEFKLVDENGLLVAGYQDNGYFGNLTGGIYTLFARDYLKCEEVSIRVPVLYFPKFFTPNNDGYNDTWEIKGIRSNDYKSSHIYIFDRYGKLLKSMALINNSWNGLYNGSRLPSSDYWFRIELVRLDGTLLSKQGNFSLKY
jgi:gliding motility-associated-like protein